MADHAADRLVARGRRQGRELVERRVVGSIAAERDADQQCE
jgi:hypothetical protein